MRKTVRSTYVEIFSEISADVVGRVRKVLNIDYILVNFQSVSALILVLGLRLKTQEERLRDELGVSVAVSGLEEKLRCQVRPGRHGWAQCFLVTNRPGGCRNDHHAKHILQNAFRTRAYKYRTRDAVQGKRKRTN